MATTVIHKRQSTGADNEVYIGRPSKWGNPFVIGRGGSREDVIASYEHWIMDQPQLLASVGELRDKILVCFCAPQACHGDVLARIANTNREESGMLYIVAGTGSRSLQIEGPTHKNYIFEEVKFKLSELQIRHGSDLTVMSGMAEGFDKALAVAAMKMGIRLWAAVPNTGYGSYYWGSKSLTGSNRLWEFDMILEYAEIVTYVCGQDLYRDGVHANFVRNTFMVSLAAQFLVYNPSSRGTAHCVREIRHAEVPYFEIK